MYWTLLYLNKYKSHFLFTLQMNYMWCGHCLRRSSFCNNGKCRNNVESESHFKMENPWTELSTLASSNHSRFMMLTFEVKFLFIPHERQYAIKQTKKTVYCVFRIFSNIILDCFSEIIYLIVCKTREFNYSHIKLKIEIILSIHKVININNAPIKKYFLNP